ncbi:patatin-like phospholipase-domain-containing protein [Lasiosphaeria miniovina]|uniref:Patatin-like phospholipase-domain-containing protein n=1 Tax=Lasiosphaeria miniovina TaxID=1954250 RepID=A0AA40A5X3_9PEZI|nr:patatin-like phospholipase-domain-containing protein [Lasiosphaeria miniovina]KAK0709738.1 patatin-like phospholipase-domain-containing protein [Lasiosphaeria miniovina]
MTDVVNPGESGSLKLPRSVSALRSSKPTPKRVPTRVSILVPEGDSTRNDVSPGARSGTSSDANLATDLQVTSTPWSRKLILTLDGGGIKGYSSLIILRALMKEAAHIEQTLKPAALSSAHTDRIARDAIPDAVYREGQYLPCHYFDYVAGTSFGGLIAIMLGMLGKTVEECTTEFHNQHKAIPLTNDVPGRVSIELPLLRKRNTWPTKRTRSFFDTFAKFSVTSTARSLATAAAASALSSATSSAVAPSEAGSTASTASEFRKDSFQCQTLAWCSEVEEHRERRPYAFCTYKEDDESEKLVSIPEVAKAITTPATSSFKPFKLGSGHFVDGSKQIRDPTLEVLKEITSLLDGGEPVIDLLLSLGTDEHQAWFYEKLRSVSSSKSSGGSSRSSADISKEEGRSYHQYHRFEVTDVKLGMRKKNYLSHIEETTEKWLESAEQKAYLRRYAEMLVKRRRARANTARWETFALGVRYHCFHEECSKNHNDRLFDSRGDFYDHLDRRHDLVRLASKNMVDVEQELDKGRQFGLS